MSWTASSRCWTGRVPGVPSRRTTPLSVSSGPPAAESPPSSTPSAARKSRRRPSGGPRPPSRSPASGAPRAASELLDWLEVRNRHHATPVPGFADDGTGLILLDLPDFDSTRAANREIVERMVGLVDVLVWVLDPQKYADAAVHNDFLTPLAAHGAVTLVVLNQIDRLPERDVPPVLESLKGHPGAGRPGQGAGHWRLRCRGHRGGQGPGRHPPGGHGSGRPSPSASAPTSRGPRPGSLRRRATARQPVSRQRRRPGWPRNWPLPRTSRSWWTPSSGPTGWRRPAAPAGR